LIAFLWVIHSEEIVTQEEINGAGENNKRLFWAKSDFSLPHRQNLEQINSILVIANKRAPSLGRNTQRRPQRSNQSKHYKEIGEP